MHLAIMIINACTPAIVLYTQGKLEGLMQFFTVPELAVEPEKGFGNKVLVLLDRVQREYPKYKQQLTKNIYTIRLLSANNFNHKVM
jgi:colanic acid/amylovoran biosynthesis protein